MNTAVLGKHPLDSPFQLPFQLDYAKNPNFTGREDLLRRLDIEVRSQTSKVIVLYGMGGMGKTQTAFEYVHTHYAEYSSVFWVNCTSEETATLGFRAIAQRLVNHQATIENYGKPNYTQIAQNLGMDLLVGKDGQLSVEKQATRRIVDAVKGWYCRKENQSWLLVLDNVDDLKSFDIRSFIPTCSHGKVLMTSRRKECSRFGKGFEIEEMMELEAVSLLLRSARCEAEGKSSH